MPQALSPWTLPAPGSSTGWCTGEDEAPPCSALHSLSLLLSVLLLLTLAAASLSMAPSPRDLAPAAWRCWGSRCRRRPTAKPSSRFWLPARRVSLPPPLARCSPACRVCCCSGGLSCQASSYCRAEQLRSPCPLHLCSTPRAALAGGPTSWPTWRPHTLPWPRWSRWEGRTRSRVRLLHNSCGGGCPCQRSLLWLQGCRPQPQRPAHHPALVCPSLQSWTAPACRPSSCGCACRPPAAAA